MDTIEQALKNFENLGFININHITSQPDTEEGRQILELERMFGVREGDNRDEISAVKELIFRDVNKISVDGRFFLDKTPQYSLRTNSCYSSLVDLRHISFGSSEGQTANYTKSIQRNKQVDDFVRARIKEVKSELGIDSDVVVFPGVVSVKIKPGFYLSGQNLHEMMDKFYRALKEFY